MLHSNPDCCQRRVGWFGCTVAAGWGPGDSLDRILAHLMMRSLGGVAHIAVGCRSFHRIAAGSHPAADIAGAADGIGRLPAHLAGCSRRTVEVDDREGTAGTLVRLSRSMTAELGCDSGRYRRRTADSFAEVPDYSLVAQTIRIARTESDLRTKAAVADSNPGSRRSRSCSCCLL